MKHTGRYAVSELIEGQFEPGSRGRVLRNLIGIKSRREMDEAEGKALVGTVEKLIRGYDSNHRFKAADLCSMHREWLGSIYAWAGKNRQVNLAKEDFTFAAAHAVPGLMADFERQCLAVYTPCRMGGGKAISRALAVVHVELLLVHPFREGTGRLVRMLATLMALQAELPLLDFSILKGRKKQEYFIAVQCGLDRDYGPMETIFDEVIAQTLHMQGQPSRSVSS
jgi:cell filamentation protein